MIDKQSPPIDPVAAARAAEWRRTARRWLDYAAEVTGERAKYAKAHAGYCESLARCWERKPVSNSPGGNE